MISKNVVYKYDQNNFSSRVDTILIGLNKMIKKNCRHWIQRNSENIKFHVIRTHSYPKSEISFLCFIKNDLTKFCKFLILANPFLGWVRCTAAWVCSNKDSWVQVLADPSSQTVGSLLSPPLAGIAGHKNLPKSKFDDFTWMEKCTKLIFIEHIWGGKKFDKPFYKSSMSISFCVVPFIFVIESYR